MTFAWSKGGKGTARVLAPVTIGVLLTLSHSHNHTLTITCTCCYDEVKGTQDLKIYSHADSQIFSHTQFLASQSHPLTDSGANLTDADPTRAPPFDRKWEIHLGVTGYAFAGSQEGVYCAQSYSGCLDWFESKYVEPGTNITILTGNLPCRLLSLSLYSLYFIFIPSL